MAPNVNETITEKSCRTLVEGSLSSDWELPSGFQSGPNEGQTEAITDEKSLKILLMDDEPQFLNSLGELLSCFGYQVVLTEDGAAAIKAYQQARIEEEPFDVVIVDLTVPGGIGGLETITYLRQFDPKIKAVVSSGYSNEPVMMDFKHYGFYGMLTKPYKFEELTEMIIKVVESE